MTSLQEQFSGTMKVRDQHAFEPAPLVRYMREHVEGFLAEARAKELIGWLGLGPHAVLDKSTETDALVDYCRALGDTGGG